MPSESKMYRELTSRCCGRQPLAPAAFGTRPVQTVVMPALSSFVAIPLCPRRSWKAACPPLHELPLVSPARCSCPAAEFLALLRGQFLHPRDAAARGDLRQLLPFVSP